VNKLKEIKNSINKDSFDRMLLAQAIAENMILITNDIKFKDFGCNNLLMV